LPQTVEPGDPSERLFVKPRQGSSSIGAQKVSRARLAEVVGQLRDPIIQEEVDGQEITIDALIDADGRPLHYVPRVRLRTLAGESIQGVTIDDGPIRDWLLLLLETSASLGARGPVTFQAFLTEQGPVLIEVNARFGGGFPLALAAGAEYPRWILASLAGERVPPMLGRYTRGLHMSRYHVELFTTDPAW
jgi:carbamoyl-phosphate synthase large subunit